MEKLYEQELIGDQTYAQELLNVQNWYNGELKRLNDILAKKRSDALVKYQERAVAAATAKKSEQNKQAQQQAQQAQQTNAANNPSGNVTTTGEPAGGTATVESYPDIDILKIRKPLEEEFVDKYAHIPMGMRNWYQRPENQIGYQEEVKKNHPLRKKKFTDKVQHKIWALEDEIADYRQEIRDLKQDIEGPSYEGSEGEIEQFFAEIGPEASEILNSGFYETDEDIIRALKDAGVKTPAEVLQNYYYYYPEHDYSNKDKRAKTEKEIEEFKARIAELEKEIDKIYMTYESVSESTYDISNADQHEIQTLKDYLDAENISYFEQEDGNIIDFDESELDPEWEDRLEDIGLEKTSYDDDDILSIEKDEEDEDDFTSQSKQIDEDKVFYVKINDKGEEFVGKVYKLFDDGDWRAKVTEGNSDTFEKLNYEPEFDEVDIIAFLRDNYDSADLIDETEFNDTIEDTNDEYIEESAQTQPKETPHKIPTLSEYMSKK